MITKEIIMEKMKKEEDEIKLHKFKIREYQNRIAELYKNMSEHEGALKSLKELMKGDNDGKKETD